MKILNDLNSARSMFKSLPRPLGFVPTMGALHQGHLSLVEQSQADCASTVVSIFVNPLQFSQGEDFEQYPRDEHTDLQQLEKLNVDAVYLPKKEELYPEGFVCKVIADRQFSSMLCGQSRPGHFDGVLTVVCKLLNIVQCDQLFMGQKDAQQAWLVRQMIADLNIPTDLRVCPIVRNSDGLALSSRNAYLSEEQRQEALKLYGSLKLAENLVRQGERHFDTIKTQMTEFLCQADQISVDYIELVDYNALKGINKVQKNALLAIAAYVDKVRLIDNIFIESDLS